MKHGLSVFLLAALSALTACGSSGTVWLDRLETARDEAGKKNVPILVNFTGSDWCSWCQKLEANVFSKDEFKAAAGKRFVLLKLDFPRQLEQSEETKAYNSRLASLFSIEGFPTILLLDKNGKAYARTGFVEGDAKNYLAHLDGLTNQMEKRDTLLKIAARTTEPAARLDAFVNAITNFSAWGILGSYPELKAEASRLDADDARGLRSKYTVEAAVGQVMLENYSKNDWEGGLARLEKMLKEYPRGEAAQLLYYHMALAATRLGRNDAAKLHLRAAITAAPKSDLVESIQRSIDSLNSDPE